MTVDVLHAVKSLSDVVVNTLRVNIPDRHILDTLRDQRLKEAKEVLDSRIETFWTGHPELREANGYRELPSSVLEGYPAQVITDYARCAVSDMTVLAANKRSLSATYAGKITKDVIKRSHLPVVVVPPRKD